MSAALALQSARVQRLSAEMRCPSCGSKRNGSANLEDRLSVYFDCGAIFACDAGLPIVTDVACPGPSQVAAAALDREARGEIALRRQPVLVLNEDWLASFAAWNLATFGPGKRTAGTIDHIKKELREIEADPDDAKEWVDIVLLGLNGLVRQGMSPAEIITAIRAKDTENRTRRWPDWRETDPNLAIEHDRTGIAVCDPDMAGVRP